MIKLATTDDTLTIVNLLKSFLQETSYNQAQEASQNFEHLCKIVWMTLQHGYIWLAHVDGKPAGVLLAVKEPNLWLPRARELKELVWYIRPEYRKNTIGGKLFLNFCKKGEELLKSGEIQGYFTTKMTTTDTIDYESRGFRQTEVTYIKE